MSYSQGKRVLPKGESGQLHRTRQLLKQEDASELTVAVGNVDGTQGGRDRGMSSAAVGCAPKGIGISGEAKTANGGNAFEKLSCNWAVTDGISRWGQWQDFAC